MRSARCRQEQTGEGSKNHHTGKAARIDDTVDNSDDLAFSSQGASENGITFTVYVMVIRIESY